MRLRKGSRVEVFSLKEARYGEWRPAEIISGDGHKYSVRYYSLGLANDEAVEERVRRKAIRPCPPQIDVDRWEAGELVEVFDNISWKTATVREELSGGRYVVLLLGAAAELTVHKANLRARQSWQDERWVMIRKVSCSLKSSTLTGSDVHQNIKPLLNSRVPQDTSGAFLRISKRLSPCDWWESAESCTKYPKKIQSVEEEGHGFDSSSMRVQASINKCGLRQMVRVRSKKLSECVGTGRSLSNGCYDTDACSVGSCSPISYNENEKPTSLLNGSSQGAAKFCSSDAESSKDAFGCKGEVRRKHSVEGGGAATSCRPELYTYRRTLEKLYASGPLNWDLETSLTDLRLSLNISSDEHSMELRNLKSIGVGNTHLQCGINCYILFLCQGKKKNSGSLNFQQSMLTLMHGLFTE